MTPEDTSFDRLSCPAPKGTRYQYLQDATPASVDSQNPKHWKYFFALDLTQCAHLLPRLIGSIVEAIYFLGPQNCVLSIVEGRSTDGTYEVLLSLRKDLENLGTTYYLTTSDIHPGGTSIADRITALAELRNLAIQPLLDSSGDKGAASGETTIIFINDVSLCMEDILELIHQRDRLGADMTCAMDWTHDVFKDPTFYDVWIARSMVGDTFFNLPPNGTWDFAHDLFWNHEHSRESVRIGQPFQVYSCWNGAIAVTAKPFVDSGVRFRAAYPGECPQGEPKSLCKDFWLNGYGKIAVVPSVNLEYTDQRSKHVKELKGYVSKWVESGEDRLIEWQREPPKHVKCITPPFDKNNPTWPEWDAPKGFPG